ncbi:Rrf2 family transcriptional regulator [bacterium]|nr:Rrf2 family transcriptional regulator [bacterium]
MLLSKSCEYAIQAVLTIARKSDGDYLPVRKIADETGISYHFLGKILQTLTKAGILNSYKGPNGGVALVRSAAETTLLDIVAAVDGLGFAQRCALGLPKCSDESQCALHEDWGKICKNMSQMLESRSILDLISFYK